MKFKMLFFLILCFIQLGQAQTSISKGMLKLEIDSTLDISWKQKRLLSYAYRTVYPAQGQDSIFKRSGFIHPIYTRKGHRLTRIQPVDHIHHYGLWNPWTHTLFEQDTVDFWNLRKGAGTVRFVRFLDQKQSTDEVGYTALHEHVVFKKDGTEKIALREEQTVRVYLPEDSANFYWIDITVALRCTTESPIRLLTYRYGGLAWRATEKWDQANSMVLTSQGTSRENTDGTRARWCLVQGQFSAKDFGGMAILSHPNNQNHPEPLRIWDNKANGGKENVFINFSPTKDRDWLLEPGKTYVLKYRLVVFDGHYDKQGMDDQWTIFASQ